MHRFVFLFHSCKDITSLVSFGFSKFEVSHIANDIINNGARKNLNFMEWVGC